MLFKVVSVWETQPISRFSCLAILTSSRTRSIGMDILERRYKQESIFCRLYDQKG